MRATRPPPFRSLSSESEPATEAFIVFSSRYVATLQQGLVTPWAERVTSGRQDVAVEAAETSKGNRQRHISFHKKRTTRKPGVKPPPFLRKTEKKTHRALKKEVEKEAAAPTYTAEDLGLTPLKKRDKLAKGEKVVVCDGSSIGWEGEVLSVRRVSLSPSSEN